MDSVIVGFILAGLLLVVIIIEYILDELFDYMKEDETEDGKEIL